MDNSCPFCNIEAKRVWLDNELAMALWDSYPCAYGHVLVVPRRQGDVEDPRGGIRWVIPKRAVYWKDKEK